LKRAEAYAEAGADAVLIHSKSKTFNELRGVYKAWSGRVPLVIILTIFDQTTAEEMEEAGAKIIIYANQPVRAAIRATKDTLEIIKKDTRPGAANDRISLCRKYMTSLASRRWSGTKGNSCQHYSYYPCRGI